MASKLIENELATNPKTIENMAVEYWLTEDGLLLLECWARDGYTIVDIAKKIGMPDDKFLKLKDKYPEIKAAIMAGKELTDYRVESALLKSALGFSTKEVKVTTTMRYGKVVETIKEVLEKDVAPNVSAIQTWLYNRQKDKWRNMNGKSVIDEMVDDSSIEITVTRATKDETKNSDAPSSSDGVEDKEITVRKRTAAETREVEKKKRAEKEKEKKLNSDTVVELHDEDKPVGKKTKRSAELDEWPEDWSDD